MPEDSRAIARQFYEGFINGGDVDLARRIVREDFVDHGPPGTAPGIEGLLAFAAMATTAFPDLHVNIEDMVAEGDRVAVRVTVRGTHQGPFLGREPTGRQGTWTGIDIVRVEDGQIAERWSERNILDLLAQLEGPEAG